MTASPGDGEHAAREGYYPDPSIPGYVRYWNGAAWVPGTSRPAAPADETGPVFLDQTSVTEALPEPDPEPVPRHAPPGWQADPAHQAGFGGPRDVRVSWGGPADPEPERRPAGISLARSREQAAAQAPAAFAPAPAPAPAPAAFAPAPATGPPGPAPAPAPAAPLAAAPAPARRLPGQAAAESVGILSARPPAWPDAPGGGAASGLTSSWPEAAPARSATPRSAPPEHARPSAHRSAAPAPAAAFPAAPRDEEVRPDRPAAPGTRPAEPAPRSPAPAAPREERPRPAVPWDDEARREPAPGQEAPAPRRRPTLPENPAPAAAVPGPAATRAVFERMAERAVRPAGLVRRGMARALDTLVLAAAAAGAAVPLVPRVTGHLQTKVDAARGSGRTTTVWLLDATTTGYACLLLAAVLLFGLLYEVLPTARWGRTPGKKLFGVRVLAVATLRPPTFGAALRRWLVGALLGLPGSLRCPFDRTRRQAWHDKAAGTYVAR
ncbi:RDD family protein [Streptomyces sp. NPDC006512]|uniref:RDD family protein n=1 Tax=Streptomyces sp. NPDC006512 TaxID=3154307 RepID=UPI0033A727B8